MNPRDYFPLGKAHGAAFCNRTEETIWLISNIQACKHSLLVAPRRFGKSSLADKAMEKGHFLFTTLNFNTCSDENEIEALIRKGVSQLINQGLGNVEKIMHLIKKYATYLTPKINLGTKYAHLELTVKNKEEPTANLEETLTLIENLLAEKKQTAVMIFDEFQTVGLVSKGSGIEASIRNIAQDMKHLSIIFSGSNRSLLQSMFEDENRPLYKICRKLRLARIAPEHYRKHLNVAARSAWNENLADNIFETIMELSERHPHYVNYLCDVLWTQCKKLPDIRDVQRAWQTVIEEEQSDANAEIASLSMGQKKIVKHIANYSGSNLMANEVVKKIEMPLSSIASAVTSLTEKDVIEKQGNEYIIINPVIKWMMKSEL